PPHPPPPPPPPTSNTPRGAGRQRCLQSDITTLHGIEDNSIESFSIMGALDGFGLGMYGEPINPDAWRLALLSVQRVLKNGGRFYLAAQIGKQDKLRFNAGRIFRLNTICDTLKEMSLNELHFLKGHDLDTYPCIYQKDGKTITDDSNLHFLCNQDSATALMIFQKL
ncbi:MAG: DUF268 domain-containing protein, partial [Helicobacter bilis]|uniref:DUF268 domain-containing protein n=1 Tax=Helicobacter bilis TaxID=37372 RepID=UPI0026EFD8B2